MREKSKWILYTIVFGLVISLFTGLFFFQSLEEQAAIPRDPSELSIATLGDLSIKKATFYRHIDQLLSQNPKLAADFFKQDPDLIEHVYVLAWQEALRFELLLNEAKDRELMLSKKQQEELLKPMLEEAGLASKKTLVETMKASGLSKKQVEASINDHLQVAYMRSLYLRDVHFEESMLPFVNTRYNIEQVQVSSSLPFNTLQDQLSALKVALIQKKPLKAFKHDADAFQIKESYLGWRDFLEMASPMRKAVMLLELKEWSNPLFVKNQYYFFKILEKDTLKTKIDVKNKEVLTRLEQQAYQTQLDSLFKNKFGEAKLETFDSILELVLAKQKNNKDDAIVAYQKLISNTPSNPVFYLGLARLYYQSGQLNEALDWYEKADIVSDLDLSYSLIQLHLEYAQLLKEKKRHKTALKQYDRAIDRASALNEYKMLLSVFETQNDKKRIKRVKQAITDLTALNDAPKK